MWKTRPRYGRPARPKRLTGRGWPRLGAVPGTLWRWRPGDRQEVTLTLTLTPTLTLTLSRRGPGDGQEVLVDQGRRAGALLVPGDTTYHATSSSRPGALLVPGDTTYHATSSSITLTLTLALRGS
eukprot:scaffold86722_cov46-Phaeocystis_antarctica.AAC.2